MAFAKAKLAREKEEAAKNPQVEPYLKFKVIEAGDAVNFCRRGDSVCLHYIGYLSDGTCFDNSYIRNQPVYFIYGAGHVIKAFEDALPFLSRGQRAKITVPPEYGYGDRGFPPIIPPKATLIYDIQLISFSSMGNAERLHREQKSEYPDT